MKRALRRFGADVVRTATDRLVQVGGEKLASVAGESLSLPAEPRRARRSSSPPTRITVSFGAGLLVGGGLAVLVTPGARQKVRDAIGSGLLRARTVFPKLARGVRRSGDRPDGGGFRRGS